MVENSPGQSTDASIPESFKQPPEKASVDALPPSTGLPTIEYLGHLSHLLRGDQSPRADQFVERLMDYYRFVDNKYGESDDPERFSGDRKITHSIVIDINATAAGIGSNKAPVHFAIAGHDLPEDVKGIEVDDIEEMTGELAAKIVDVMTKVNLDPKKAREYQTEEEREKHEEAATEDKILKAIVDCHKRLGIYGKIFDVDHNMDTIWHDPEPGRRVKKSGRALTLFEPLARRLGLIYQARRIGGNALSVVKPQEVAAIESTRDRVLSAKLLRRMQERADYWTEHGIEDGENLKFISITTESPTNYEVYQKNEVPGVYNPEDVFPNMKVLTTDPTEALRFYKYLSDKYGLTEEEKRSNPFQAIADGQPLTKKVPIVHDGKRYMFDVVLSTPLIEIAPFHLDFFEEHLTEEQKQEAGKKLETLQQAYKQAAREQIQAGDTSERFKDVLDRGQFPTFRPDGKEQIMPEGATVLDFAYYVGRDLGSVAKSAIIIRNGEEIEADLSDSIQPGDEIKIITDEDAVVTPEKYDQATTKKALNDIEQAIKSDEGTNKKAIDTASYFRGIELLLWFFKEERDKSLDAHIIDGFDEHLTNKYKTEKQKGFINFFQRLGTLPFPGLQKKFYSDWIERADNYDVISDLIRLRNNLIKERESRGSQFIYGLGDQGGRLAVISKLWAEKGLSVNPIHGRPHHMRWDLDQKPSKLELVHQTGTEDQIAAFTEELDKAIPGITVVFTEDLE